MHDQLRAFRASLIDKKIFDFIYRTSIIHLRHVKSTTSFTILIRFKRRTLYLSAAFSLAFFHLLMGLYTFVKTQDYFQELDSEIIDV